MTTTWRDEILWASGLFEGEGCFTQSMGKYPAAVISSTDLDVLDRFVAAVGIKRGIFRRKKDKRKETYKQAYQVTYSGVEVVQALGAMLWNGLGSRRRARLAEVLRNARSVRSRSK